MLDDPGILGIGDVIIRENRSMAKKGKRIFGDKISFKSLTCAPVNELGVVYLFGVLHDTFDFKIESIQAGFPDCIARRKIGKNRWCTGSGYLDTRLV